MLLSKPKQSIHEEIGDIFSELSGNPAPEKPSTLAKEECTCNGFKKPEVAKKNPYDSEHSTELPYRKKTKR